MSHHKDDQEIATSCGQAERDYQARLYGPIIQVGWNPFSAVTSAVAKVTQTAVKAAALPFSLASKAPSKITPADLKAVLRWTPEGLVIRSGVKMTQATKDHLATTVKWSPHGMVFKGVEHPLEPAAIVK